MPVAGPGAPRQQGPKRRTVENPPCLEVDRGQAEAAAMEGGGALDRSDQWTALQAPGGTWQGYRVLEGFKRGGSEPAA